MNKKIITATVFRFDPHTDAKPHYHRYKVPVTPGMCAMNVLDYIYENLDSTLSYYDHAACNLGFCMRCVGKINGKSGFFCQTIVEDNVTIEPLKQDEIIKDLVVKKKKKH